MPPLLLSALVATAAATSPPLLLSAMVATAAETSPGRYTSWRGQTFLDTTVDGRSGSCSLLLTQPPSSSHAVLHITLRGHGTRALSATTLRHVGLGLDKCRCDQIVCIVKMTESRGASVLALPAIAQFIIIHGSRLGPIFVVEAEGMALAAVRVIKRLSGLDRRIRCYRTRGDFEAACSASPEAYHRHALSVSRLASPRREKWGSFSSHWQGQWREQCRGVLATLRGGAYACGGPGAGRVGGRRWWAARVRAKSAVRPIMGTLPPPLPSRASESPRRVNVHIDGVWYDLSTFAHPGGADLIARHTGTDISHLFYSNHWDPTVRCSLLLE